MNGPSPPKYQITLAELERARSVASRTKRFSDLDLSNPRDFREADNAIRLLDRCLDEYGEHGNA